MAAALTLLHGFPQRRPKHGADAHLAPIDLIPLLPSLIYLPLKSALPGVVAVWHCREHLIHALYFGAMTHTTTYADIFPFA